MIDVLTVGLVWVFPVVVVGLVVWRAVVARGDRS